MREQLRQALRPFPPEKRYLAGLSGGRDSTALFHLLLGEGYRNLVVCHLNHGWRGTESDEDEAFVRELAGSAGVPAEVCRERVDGGEGKGLEDAAREARLKFFSDCARRHRCPRIFLGHHGDDQAETVLMRLLRGAGKRGLSGMAPRSVHGELELLRPLLGFRRDEIPAPPRYREDSSNASPFFLRNRIRHRLIPAIEAVTGRAAAPMLMRWAEVERAEEAWLRERAEAAFEGCRRGLELAVAEMRAQPLALQRRVIQRWLEEGRVGDAGFQHVEAIRGLIEPGSRHYKVNLPGDRHARRRQGRLFFELPSS